MSKKIVGVITPSVPIVGEITATGASAYEVWLSIPGNEGGSLQDFINALDKHYEHNQVLSSDTWEIEHNLKKFPSVTIIDSADTVVYGSITYIDKNNIEIKFSGEFAGKAYLN